MKVCKMFFNSFTYFLLPVDCQVAYYSLRALTTHLVFDHDDFEVFQHVSEDETNSNCLFQCIYCSHGETNLSKILFTKLNNLVSNRFYDFSLK